MHVLDAGGHAYASTEILYLNPQMIDFDLGAPVPREYTVPLEERAIPPRRLNRSTTPTVLAYHLRGRKTITA